MNPMETAPLDGTCVLIKAQQMAFLPERQGSHFRVLKPQGTRWVECRYHDERWQEWLGHEKRQHVGTITPLAWAPLPDA